MGDPRTMNFDKKIVIVTGFGPFAGHPVNASWEAVKELSKIGLQAKEFHLVTREIPVTYAAVRSEIPKLWKEFKPHLVVHVGVSQLAQELTIEKVARNSGYVKTDIDGKVDEFPCCCPSGPASLVSELKLDIVCDSVNHSPCKAMAITSTDAGRYLCEFIYYMSLSQDCSRVVFIHVPPLDKPYSAAQLASGIQSAIEAILQQLNDRAKN